MRKQLSQQQSPCEASISGENRETISIASTDNISELNDSVMVNIKSILNYYE